MPSSVGLGRGGSGCGNEARNALRLRGSVLAELTHETGFVDGLSVAVGFRGRQRDREVAEVTVRLPGGSGLGFLGHAKMLAASLDSCRYASVQNSREFRAYKWKIKLRRIKGEYDRIGRYGTGRTAAR